MSAHDDPLVEREQIVGMLRNLLLFFELGGGGGYLHKDNASDEREELLCLFTSLQKTIPTLPEAERDVVSLMGMQGLSECEAAAALGISRQAVNKRLWSAATRIQKIWFRRLRTGGANGM